MPGDTFITRLERVTSVRDRSLDLFEKMTLDPSRPFWQVELTSILYEVLCMLDQLDTSTATAADLLVSYEKRIASLEQRYSQLLFAIKSQQQ